LRFEDRDVPSRVGEYGCPPVVGGADDYGVRGAADPLLLEVIRGPAFSDRREAPGALSVARERGSQRHPLGHPSHGGTDGYLGHLNATAATVNVKQPQGDPSLSQWSAFSQQHKPLQRLTFLDDSDIVEE
jgi:hypothetical protein